MKKLLAILLALSFVFAFAACGGSKTENPPASQNLANFETAAPEVEDDELPSFKIAFGYGQWESVLGAEHKSAQTYLGNAFKCEMVFFEAGNGDEGVAAIESLLAGGDIDGIVCVGWDTARMAVADRYGVPVITVSQLPSDQEIDGVAAYDLYLGGVLDDEIWAGYQAMKALYDAGCRNVTWSGLTAGYAKGHDNRTAGAKMFLEEHPDLNLLTESYTTGKWDEDVPTFVASFPEMDGMCFTALNDAVYNAMETEGIADGSVKVAGPDLGQRTGEFFERGIQVWSCGGQYSTGMIAWAIMYNYLADGTRIIADSKEPLPRNYLEITSFDDYKHYEECINSPQPVYSGAEIKEMIHYFNPAITYADYVRIGQEYSIADILARQGK